MNGCLALGIVDTGSCKTLLCEKTARDLGLTVESATGSEFGVLVNSDADGKAWFFKLRIADKSELGGMMDEATYKAHTA